MTLDEIAARADAATEGPWVRDGMDSGHSQFETGWWIATPDGDIICDMDGLDRSRNEFIATDDGGLDGVFIAHAREDVPRLVAALRAVEALHADDGRGICVHCTHINGYQMQSHPCPTITAIREALGS